MVLADGAVRLALFLGQGDNRRRLNEFGALHGPRREHIHPPRAEASRPVPSPWLERVGFQLERVVLNGLSLDPFWRRVKHQRDQVERILPDVVVGLLLRVQSYELVVGVDDVDETLIVAPANPRYPIGDVWPTSLVRDDHPSSRFGRGWLASGPL